MPPEFVISIKSKNDEFMVGVTCERHKETFAQRLIALQENGKVPKGSINFDTLKPVGTNCIRIDPNDLIEL